MTTNRIIHISFSPPEIYPKPPRCPRDKWKLEQQLKRLENHLEASRGEVMNLDWLGWMDQYMAVQDALEAGIDNSPV